MAKMTLLEMVQDIASDMDDDYINSISDSVEALQIATIIKHTYYFLVENVLDLPEHKKFLTLTNLVDTSHPNYLGVPDAIKEIESIKYDNSTTTSTDLDYREVKYLRPLDFTSLVNRRKESDANVTKIDDFSAGSILIQTDKMPQYWTSFDDQYVIFDSYDSGEEATVQSSRAQVFGSSIPTWTMSDSFTPDLDANLFPLLYNEAKAACFVDLKQVENTKSERRAREQKTHLHNNVHITKRNRHEEQPNYGRFSGRINRRPIDIKAP